MLIISVLGGLGSPGGRGPPRPRAPAGAPPPPGGARLEVTLGAVMVVIGMGLVVGTWPT